MIDSSMKVRDVAVQLPQATKVFEKLNIDYCCGGDQPLADACATAGIDMPELEQLLAAAETERTSTLDFQTLTLTDLITHILNTHHVYTKDQIARLEPLADKVIAAHGENHEELVAIRELLQRLIADLNPHMFKEEQILFPYIVSLEQAAKFNRPAPFAPFGTVNNPVRMMMIEHDVAGEILREMRKLSADYAVPSDACMSYQTFYRALDEFEQDLHQHIHLENNILFPRALEIEENF